MFYLTYSYNSNSKHLSIGCFHNVSTLSKVAVRFHAGNENKSTSFAQEVTIDTRETIIDCLERICKNLGSEHNDQQVIDVVTLCADVNLGAVGVDHVADIFLDQTIPSFFRGSVVYLELESGDDSIVENANILIKQLGIENINVRMKGSPRNQTPMRKFNFEHSFFQPEFSASASCSSPEEISAMDLTSPSSDSSREISPVIPVSPEEQPFILCPISLEKIHEKKLARNP